LSIISRKIAGHDTIIMAWDKEGVVIIPQMMNGLRALAPNMVNHH
jgi:hypothetical protein